MCHHLWRSFTKFKVCPGGLVRRVHTACCHYIISALNLGHDLCCRAFLCLPHLTSLQISVNLNNFKSNPPTPMYCFPFLTQVNAFRPKLKIGSDLHQHVSSLQSATAASNMTLWLSQHAETAEVTSKEAQKWNISLFFLSVVVSEPPETLQEIFKKLAEIHSVLFPAVFLL